MTSNTSKSGDDNDSSSQQDSGEKKTPETYDNTGVEQRKDYENPGIEIQKNE